MTTYSTDYDTQTKVENNRSFARSSPECRPITSDRGRFAKIYCPWLTSLLDMSLSQPPSSPNPTSLLTQPSFSPNLPPHPTSLLTQPPSSSNLPLTQPPSFPPAHLYYLPPPMSYDAIPVLKSRNDHQPVGIEVLLHFASSVDGTLASRCFRCQRCPWSALDDFGSFRRPINRRKFGGRYKSKFRSSSVCVEMVASRCDTSVLINSGFNRKLFLAQMA